MSPPPMYRLVARPGDNGGSLAAWTVRLDRRQHFRPGPPQQVLIACSLTEMKGEEGSAAARASLEGGQAMRLPPGFVDGASH